MFMLRVALVFSIGPNQRKVRRTSPGEKSERDRDVLKIMTTPKRPNYRDFREKFSQQERINHRLSII